MLSPLRNRFGIPGVISVIALVFAMLGGAYAASNDNGGKASASAKAKRGPRGPKGPAGPAGPAGPVGPAGAKGDTGVPGADGKEGPQGKEGAQGKDGSQGKEGKSITNTTEPAGTANCAGQGGTKLTGTSTTYACNGKEGSPWTAGGTLPAGKTETGAWSFHGGAKEITVEVEGVKEEITVGQAEESVPISFPIPLASGLDSAHVHAILTNGKEVKLNFATFETEELIPTACGSPVGTAANPVAQSGHLCVYVGDLLPGTIVFGRSSLGGFNTIVDVSGGTPGTSTAGAQLNFSQIFPEISLEGTGWGSWAVTG